MDVTGKLTKVHAIATMSTRKKKQPHPNFTYSTQIRIQNLAMGARMLINRSSVLLKEPSVLNVKNRTYQ